MAHAPAGGPGRAPTDALDAAVPPGTAAGEYVIDGPLGHGAFGDVYAAHHPVIGKAVAVKVLKMRYSVDPDIVSRFLSEARAVNRIGHEGVVDIFAFGQLADGRQYYVMELLAGETLRDRLARGPLTLDEALDLLTPVAQALDAAHAAGIAHRDLKPENVFLVGGGDTCQPKLLDFGVAKLQGEITGHRTRTGATVGTPAYMAPEQCVGGDVDTRADLYAFGVLLYEALAGARPFDGETAFELMAAHVDEVPPPLRARAPAVPVQAAAWIEALLAKDPAARPAPLAQGMAHLRGALLLSEVPPLALPRSPRSRAAWAAVALLGAAGLAWALWPTPPAATATVTALPRAGAAQAEATLVTAAPVPEDAAPAPDAAPVPDRGPPDAGPPDAVPPDVSPAPRRRRRATRQARPPRGAATPSSGLNDLEPW
ncbi:MAG: serine/threonine protein kinase [Myxococcales bacterium]|nr:serine/threonine protein kinase [Myxococcales bacterium]